MSANRNLKQVRIENSSPAAAPPMSMVGGGSMKGLRGLEPQQQAPPPDNEGAAAAMGLGKEEEEASSGGFTVDIKSFLKPGEKSYTQRCRLFVGNLPTDITEEDFKRLFERYGEPSEVFINRDRGFGFIRLVRSPPPPAALGKPLISLGPVVPVSAREFGGGGMMLSTSSYVEAPRRPPLPPFSWGSVPRPAPSSEGDSAADTAGDPRPY